MRTLHFAWRLAGQFLAIVLVLTAFAPAGALAQGGYMAPPPPDRQELDQFELRKEAEDALQDGVAALKAGDYELAEQNFEAVLAYDPDNAMVHYLMGLAKVGNDDLSGARKHLQLAIKFDPQYIEARQSLAVISIEMDDLAGAQEQLDALLAMRERCAASNCADLAAITEAAEFVQEILLDAVR